MTAWEQWVCVVTDEANKLSLKIEISNMFQVTKSISFSWRISFINFLLSALFPFDVLEVCSKFLREWEAKAGKGEGFKSYSTSPTFMLRLSPVTTSNYLLSAPTTFSTQQPTSLTTMTTKEKGKERRIELSGGQNEEEWTERKTLLLIFSTWFFHHCTTFQGLPLTHTRSSMGRWKACSSLLFKHFLAALRELQRKGESTLRLWRRT